MFIFFLNHNEDVRFFVDAFFFFLNLNWQKQDTFKIGEQLLESFSKVNSEHKHIH